MPGCPVEVETVGAVPAGFVSPGRQRRACARSPIPRIAQQGSGLLGTPGLRRDRPRNSQPTPAQPRPRRPPAHAPGGQRRRLPITPGGLSLGWRNRPDGPGKTGTDRTRHRLRGLTPLSPEETPVRRWLPGFSLHRCIALRCIAGADGCPAIVQRCNETSHPRVRTVSELLPASTKSRETGVYPVSGPPACRPCGGSSGLSPGTCVAGGFGRPTSRPSVPVSWTWRASRPSTAGWSQAVGQGPVR
jgi:hypothetical protein